MAQLVKALAAKSDGLSSILRTHMVEMVEGKKHAAFTWHKHMCVHTDTQKKINKCKNKKVFLFSKCQFSTPWEMLANFF